MNPEIPLSFKGGLNSRKLVYICLYPEDAWGTVGQQNHLQVRKKNIQPILTAILFGLHVVKAYQTISVPHALKAVSVLSFAC